MCALGNALIPAYVRTSAKKLTESKVASAGLGLSRGDLPVGFALSARNGIRVVCGAGTHLQIRRPASFADLDADVYA